MMTRAYDKFFLPGVMKNLGFACDFAVNACELSADSFYDFFIASQVASQIESGSPVFLCGCSGTELALTVFNRVGYEFKNSEKFFSSVNDFVRFDRSPEYWAGWILAFYQWHTQLSFSKIRDYITFSQVVKMYHPLHEAPEEKFVEILNAIIKEKAQKKTTNLHLLRKSSGLTQKELAELSGVNLRTLQQYETGAKNINHASGVAINALAKVLHCNFYDVMEFDITPQSPAPSP